MVASYKSSPGIAHWLAKHCCLAGFACILSEFVPRLINFTHINPG